MHFTLRLLGAEVFHVSAGRGSGDQPDDPARDLSGGTTVSTPIGFTTQPRDQRWEPPLREEEP